MAVSADFPIFKCHEIASITVIFECVIYKVVLIRYAHRAAPRPSSRLGLGVALSDLICPVSSRRAVCPRRRAGRGHATSFAYSFAYCRRFKIPSRLLPVSSVAILGRRDTFYCISSSSRVHAACVSSLPSFFFFAFFSSFSASSRKCITAKICPVPISDDCIPIYSLPVSSSSSSHAGRPYSLPLTECQIADISLMLIYPLVPSTGNMPHSCSILL